MFELWILRKEEVFEVANDTHCSGLMGGDRAPEEIKAGALMYVEAISRQKCKKRYSPFIGRNSTNVRDLKITHYLPIGR